MARSRDVGSSYVLFFFNACESVALWHQKVFELNSIGIWDYHVVLLDAARGEIYDYDTRLDSPLAAHSYLSATFGRQQQLPIEFRTTVRVVPAQEFLLRFNSDRSHMLDENGIALVPFPDWPAIVSSQPITLSQYTSVDSIPDSDSFLVAVDAFDPDLLKGL